MSPRPTIFISAVSKELKASRQLVSNTLQFLGYEPVWQDIFGTEQGDLRAMLQQKIDGCRGLVQLVGQCYGAEPPAPDEQFGRVSYTQYEALYAKKRGKKVWYLFLDDVFPRDAHEAEPAEFRALQVAYRQRLQSQTDLYHPLASREGLETSVLKLRDDLRRLRRGAKQWAAAVILLLVLLVGAVIWLQSGQRQEQQQLTAMREEMAKLTRGVEQFPEVQNKIRQQQPEQATNKVQQSTYEELGKQLGLDPKLLQAKLPAFAQELAHSTKALIYDRASAAYVLKDYAEAERLALSAAAAAQKATPPKISDAIKALELAGNSADARIEYADALRHYREAAQLTDRVRDPIEWANAQWKIASVLLDQGQYAEAEKTYRSALEEYQRTRGAEDTEILTLRISLALALDNQGKYAEAESEDRAVLKLREKVLGSEHPDTLTTRNNLVGVLDSQGKYAEAEAEGRAVIRLEEKVLGPEHPDTLTTRANLAVALDSQGKYAEAEAEDRAVLKLREKVLGSEHPDTLTTRNNLVSVLDNQGKYAEAEAEGRAVLKLHEKVLGPEHPDTLLSRNNLAAALDSQGKHAEAEAEDRALIKLLEKVLGPEHPTLLTTRNNLANVLYSQGKYGEAEAEFRSVLKLREKVLGHEHPYTLRSLYCVAVCLQAENQLVEAKEFAQRATEGATQVLGAEHPDTLKYKNLWLKLQTKK